MTEDEVVARVLFDHEWSSTPEHHRPDYDGDFKAYWVDAARAAITALDANRAADVDRMRSALERVEWEAGNNFDGNCYTITQDALDALTHEARTALEGSQPSPAAPVEDE